jgi:hypothetical protein
MVCADDAGAGRADCRPGQAALGWQFPLPIQTDDRVFRGSTLLTNPAFARPAHKTAPGSVYDLLGYLATQKHPDPIQRLFKRDPAAFWKPFQEEDICPCPTYEREGKNSLACGVKQSPPFSAASAAAL